jgi:hypothetical protein
MFQSNEDNKYNGSLVMMKLDGPIPRSSDLSQGQEEDKSLIQRQMKGAVSDEKTEEGCDA